MTPVSSIPIDAFRRHTKCVRPNFASLHAGCIQIGVALPARYQFTHLKQTLGGSGESSGVEQRFPAEGGPLAAFFLEGIGGAARFHDGELVLEASVDKCSGQGV